MTDNDYFTPILIVLGCTAVMFFVLGLTTGTSTARRETEEQTVVYCVEKPSACKTKYDYYKLENQK
jgi:hypothetical protein